MNIQNEVITSRNNPYIKWVSSLKDKKAREESRCFFAEGIKLTLEALSAGVGVTNIIINESKKEKFIPMILSYKNVKAYENTAITLVKDTVFEKISTERSPEGIMAVIKYLDFFKSMDIIYKEDFFLKEDERAIILCSVRDPSNLGSVIRSAVAFGVEHIIMSKDSADLYNSKTLRSAMGSIFRVKFTSVSSLEALISSLRFSGRSVYAAELTDRAVALSELELKSTDCFIIGNEGHGIPTEISSVCDGSVYIPISKKTESLNASVAAGIFIWEQSKR